MSESDARAEALRAHPSGPPAPPGPGELPPLYVVHRARTESEVADLARQGEEFGFPWRRIRRPGGEAVLVFEVPGEGALQRGFFYVVDPPEPAAARPDLRVVPDPG